MTSQTSSSEPFPTRLGRYEIKEAAAKKQKALTKAQSLPKSSNIMEISAANVQLASLFLQKVSFDIRLIIYRNLLVDIGATLHIESRGKHQKTRAAQPCELIEPYQPPGPGTRFLITEQDSWGLRHKECRWAALSQGQTTNELKTYFALAYSCRKIYTEMIEAIYARVNFYFVHPSSAQNFFQVTPKLQLDLIRSLRISWMVDRAVFKQQEFQFVPGKGSRKKQVETFIAIQELYNTWHNTCEVLSKMQSLSSLQIVIYTLAIWVSEREVLQPLFAIEGLEDFEVLLPWDLEHALDPLDGESPKPFRIRRVGPYEDGHFIWPGVRICGYPRRMNNICCFCLPRYPVQYFRRRLEWAGYI